jgi:hypothetical protein
MWAHLCARFSAFHDRVLVVPVFLRVAVRVQKGRKEREILDGREEGREGWMEGRKGGVTSIVTSLRLNNEFMKTCYLNLSECE